jgi:hypothetical protein
VREGGGRLITLPISTEARRRLVINRMLHDSDQRWRVTVEREISTHRSLHEATGDPTYAKPCGFCRVEAFRSCRAASGHVVGPHKPRRLVYLAWQADGFPGGAA